MALDRWLALIILGICCVYGYTAWFLMDGSLAPFMRRNPVWPSTFPKILSIVCGLTALWVLVFQHAPPGKKTGEIDYRRLLEYKLQQAGGLILLLLNLPLIPYIAKLLAIPRNYLIPFILFFTLMGSYIGQNNPTELLILVGLGIAATAFHLADYPLAPLLIGFILGRMLEDNFARAMQIYDGPSFLWERPMTIGLLVLAVLLIFLPSYRQWRAEVKIKKARERYDQ